MQWGKRMTTSGSKDDRGVVATYRIREAVGVFHDLERMERAVEELELAGFDRSQINVITSKEEAERRLGRPIRDIREIEETGEVPTDAPPLEDDVETVRVELLSTLAAIGSIGAIGAVVATGGGLAAAIAAALAGGGASGSLAALLARWLDEKRARQLEEQLRAGGLLLFVAVRNPEQEKKAVEILRKYSAEDVHVHEIERTWTEDDIPFAKAQPDPFLLD